MEGVALFVAENKEDFFVEKACINCTVDKFCACDDASKLFDIDAVMEKELVDVGGGIKVSEPVKVERKLRSEGGAFSASLSHRGILAIYSYDSNNEVQFTDLNSNRQAELEVENDTSVAFYDNKMILLTDYMPLREAVVEDVFRYCDLSQFGEMGEVNMVDCNADVSLLNATRVLYYPTKDHKLFSFNVDTRENREIGKKVGTCASLTGVDCGVRVVFMDYYDNITYSLNTDNSVDGLERQSSLLTTVLPSGSNPANIRRAALRYCNYLMYRGRKVEFKIPFRFESFHSVIRIYRDIFLLYDCNTSSWVLTRIIIP